jgi:DNA-directed RNA polymerase subunit K/omega
MSQNRAIFVGIALLLLGVGLYGLIHYFNRNNIDWSENYTTADTTLEEANHNPYGLYVVENLLKTYFPNQTFHKITKKISVNLPEEANNATYIFIGDGMAWDSLDSERLRHFVEQGNNAFISSNIMAKALIKPLFEAQCAGDTLSSPPYLQNSYSLLSDSIVQLSFLATGTDSNRFELAHITDTRTRLSHWAYLANSPCGTTKPVQIALGQINQTYTNFAVIPYKKGNFYIHTTPEIFTNINLLQKNVLSYASVVFSHLRPSTIYWESSSHVSSFVTERMNGQKDATAQHKSNPLAYILKQPALRWGWYLLLFGLLSYLVFRAKRRQRIIPVLDIPSNTSLEFIKTISAMHFLRSDHKAMATQQTNYFLSYIRERYKVSTTKLDDTLAQQLALRSNVEEKIIKTILYEINYVETRNTLTDKELISIYQALAVFYRKI